MWCLCSSYVLSIAFGVDFSTVVIHLFIYFDSKRVENPSWRMKQPVVVMSTNPAFATNESGYSPLQRTAALGYLGVVNGGSWDLAVPSRLFDSWILVHHCRHWWRMCTASDCVSNADLPTSQAISCGRAYHVGPLFLVPWRKSTLWFAPRSFLLWSRKVDVVILSHIFVISLILFGRMDAWHIKAGLAKFNAKEGHTIRYALV